MASTTLTSTTAPGKVFSSRQELQEHYKSDWHKYNLKRRQANLPLLLESDFKARLQAAHSLLNEKKEKGQDHLKTKTSKNASSKKQQQQQNGAGGAIKSLQAAAYERIKQQKQQQQEQEQTDTDQNPDVLDKGKEPMAVDQAGSNQAEVVALDEVHNDATMKDEDEQKKQVEQEDAVDDGGDEMLIEIDPKQCLFDRHISASVTSNVERMQRKYGFFIPDREYLTDITGLIGYCHEKIKLGHVCLYCQKVFTTWHGTQKHMISKQHTKLAYEQGIDLEDLSIFYDFEIVNRDFMRSIGVQDDNREQKTHEANADDQDAEMDVDNGKNGPDEEEDGWEDVTDDEKEEGDEMDEDDDDYQEEIVQRMGFEVTALGELVLPDGRIVGHRDLKRYYKQRLRPAESSNEAVVAAQQAARERLYRGRVYTLEGSSSSGTVRVGGGASSSDAIVHNKLALMHAGIKPGMVSARAVKGILTDYNQLSIYRLRAALRKQDAGERRGRKLEQRGNMNMNKMDKKGNRLINNINVQMAPR